MSRILDRQDRSRIRWCMAAGLLLQLAGGWLLISSYTHHGGCDGGLCALEGLSQLSYTFLLWLINMAAAVAVGISLSKKASRYTAANVFCTTSLVAAALIYAARDYQAAYPAFLPVAWPAILYAAALFILINFFLRNAMRWEDVTETDLLQQ